jgi:hypothetical protein
VTPPAGPSWRQSLRENISRSWRNHVPSERAKSGVQRRSREHSTHRHTTRTR